MLEHPERDGNGRADGADSMIEFARDQAAKAKKLGTRSSPVFPSKECVPGYELAELIHRGGQGVVYRAIQKSTGRVAAIKFLPLPLKTEGLDASRFRREVRALARVENQSVVAVRDSGVVGGYGYVVMDYVPGTSLTEYVGERKLDVRDTLRLFLRVCDAVHAAHLQGVIHRDLKPSNIRVTPEGEPRILDFGLARIITEQEHRPHEELSVATISGQFLGSLPWASPEQARGDSRNVDVRTDVYALGVILFQLLTGDFPYAVVGDMRSVVSRILETQPSKPSAYNRDANDDLDTIVLKCLQKERERRYQGVADLARDVTNFLEGRPIEAKRDSVWYVARKNLRRHWVASLVVSLIAVFGIVYATSTTVLLRENRLARQEQARSAADARAKFRLAHQTVQIVLQELAARFERTSGTTDARRAVLKAAYASLKPLADEQSGDPDLTVDLGRTHALLGDIALKLGEVEEGRNHLGNALQIRRKLVEQEPSTLSHWDDLSINLVRIGDSYGEAGEYVNAVDFYQEALQIDETLVERDPTNTHFRDNLGWSYERLGNLAQLDCDLVKADEWYAKAVSIFEQLVAEEPTSGLRLHGLSNIKLKLALLRWDCDGGDTVTRLIDESIDAGERAVRAEPLNPDFRRSLSCAYGHRSNRLRDMGASDEAWQALNRAEALVLELWEADRDDLRSISPLYWAWKEKAELAERRDDLEVAERYWKQILELTAYGVSRDGANVGLVRKRYTALRDYALFLLRRGEAQSAYESPFAEALSLAGQAASPATASYEVVVEYSELLRIVHPVTLRDSAASVREAERAVELTRGVLPNVLAYLAEALVADGQFSRAREVQRQALSLLSVGASPTRNRIINAVPE